MIHRLTILALIVALSGGLVRSVSAEEERAPRERDERGH